VTKTGKQGSEYKFYTACTVIKMMVLRRFLRDNSVTVDALSLGIVIIIDNY
jgi:hypothetical protein